jgi:hypothetical protein
LKERKEELRVNKLKKKKYKNEVELNIDWNILDNMKWKIKVENMNHSKSTL